MDPFAPPVAFHFSVTFLGLMPPVPDMAFQEVSGLETELEVKALEEGGENTFVHQLPVKVKQPNLVLKRGLTTQASGLLQWCKSTLEGGFAEPITPKDLTVSLLNEMGLPVAVWSVGNAYPVKWAVGGFDAMKNELAIETIEFAVNGVQRTV